MAAPIEVASRGVADRPYGHGAFGNVYLKHDSTGVYVVKEVNVSGRRELAVLTNLPQHPNIVAFYSSRGQQVTDGALQFAMEFCNDGDLDQWIRTHPCGLDDKELLTLLADLTCAVRFLHERRMYHRDIKPQNIGRMLSRLGPVYKLIDFGSLADLNKGDQNLLRQPAGGTLAYMHPTLWAAYYKKRVSVIDVAEKADLWSIGVTLLHAVVGRFPFAEKEHYERFYEHFRTDVKCPPLALRSLPIHCSLSPALRATLRPLLSQLVSNNLHYDYTQLFDDVQRILKLPALQVIVLDPRKPLASLRTRILYGVDSMETLRKTLHKKVANYDQLEAYFVYNQLNVQRELSDAEIAELSVKGANPLERYSDYERSARLVCCLKPTDTNQSITSTSEADNTLADQSEQICEMKQLLCYGPYAKQLKLQCNNTVVYTTRQLESDELRCCLNCSTVTMCDLTAGADIVASCADTFYRHADSVLYPRTQKSSSSEVLVRKALRDVRQSERCVQRWRSWGRDLRQWRGRFEKLQRDYPRPQHLELYQRAADAELSAQPMNDVNLDDVLKLVAACCVIDTEVKRLKQSSVRRKNDPTAHRQQHADIKRLMNEISTLHQMCANSSYLN